MPNAAKPLTNKVAVVTGSTSGIGLGIANALARAGASVLLNGLTDDVTAQRLCEDMESTHQVKAIFHPADMSKPDQIHSMIIKAKAKLGSVDILVNNAGIQYVSPIEEFPSEKWDALLAVNLTSAFHSIRTALPMMRERGWGRIINIASAHGLVASAGKSAYVAAKHGLIGLTKAVALETSTTSITCNAICPGWVLTPLVERQITDRAKVENLSYEESKRRLLLEKQPSGEFATAEQIGDAACFLCSESAAQIRGLAMNIDGGWIAQ